MLKNCVPLLKNVLNKSDMWLIPVVVALGRLKQILSSILAEGT